MSDEAFRRVSADRGLAWIIEGFDLFKQAPLLWIGMLVLWVIAAFLVSIVPVLGSLAVNLCFAAVMGGFLLGAHEQSEGRPLSFDTLLAGFRPPHLEPLLLLGLAYLLIGLAVAAVAVVLGFLLVGSAVFSGNMQDLHLGVGVIVWLIMALLMFMVFSLATWFAPGLIVFRGYKVIDALKLSFAAALGNLGALAVTGLVGIGIVLVAMIPFGLGMLVALPVFLASSYRCYRDIFGAGAAPAVK
ncbi:hypothetical protein D0B54_14175 [Solimonas sp. K1W22B-7]|uniref:BPSS1780 family membrane protein n=1 Tax=Solimonas sp. K1W22B-7 TaxID=2303331 RepID=UPI000E337C4A|nr:BPSS1780 family membrane protein [Solimonas sp. K1W22B-7]AXQ29750.1 hypothetical protein D0B54_14175 [Solimonas sp. K1W22B-7]